MLLLFGRKASAISEVSQDIESEQEKLDRLTREEYLEKKAREEEEERKVMVSFTLEVLQNLTVFKKQHQDFL